MATPYRDAGSDEDTQSKEVDWAKRYKDLQSYNDRRFNEVADKLGNLEKMLTPSQPTKKTEWNYPSDPEKFKNYVNSNPDTVNLVKTLTAMNTEDKFSKLEQGLLQSQEENNRLKVERALDRIKEAHPDWDEIKSSSEFKDWLEDQPQAIADGVTRNSTDAKWAIKVISMYKNESGSAEYINTSNPSVSKGKAPGKLWKESEISKLKPWEFDKYEEEIDLAQKEGRIQYGV